MRLEPGSARVVEDCKTWSEPHSIGVWGLPSHLLRLQDERLLMTYGHRRVSMGNRAPISLDHGRTWSEPLVLSADGNTGDLGYPSTVELIDGTLVTVWYEVMRSSPKAVLRQAKGKLLRRKVEQAQPQADDIAARRAAGRYERTMAKYFGEFLT